MSVDSRSSDDIVPTSLTRDTPLVVLRIAGEARRLRILRRLIREIALEHGCSEACARDIVIAVDEACQNVIRHAYGGEGRGDVVVEVRSDGASIAFSIVDFAMPVNPNDVQPRCLDDIRPGGLGTHFINECMDDWCFREPPSGAGNCLWMVKKIQ